MSCRYLAAYIAASKNSVPRGRSSILLLRVLATTEAYRRQRRARAQPNPLVNTNPGCSSCPDDEPSEKIGGSQTLGRRPRVDSAAPGRRGAWPSPWAGLVSAPWLSGGRRRTAPKNAFLATPRTREPRVRYANNAAARLAQRMLSQGRLRSVAGELRRLRAPRAATTKRSSKPEPHTVGPSLHGSI